MASIASRLPTRADVAARLPTRAGVAAGARASRNYVVKSAQKYGRAVQASMAGGGSKHKTLGIILTFILMFAASVALMADKGANITAYTVILCLLLFPTTLLLVVSNFTKATRLGPANVANINYVATRNGPKPDFVIFFPVYLALILAVVMCIIPMLAFVETDSYADGSTVTPGHSGVQTMDRGQRLGVGITGFLLTLILFGVYFATMRKTAQKGAVNTAPFVRTYQGARMAAGGLAGTAAGAVASPVYAGMGFAAGVKSGLENVEGAQLRPGKEIQNSLRTLGRAVGGAVGKGAAGTVVGAALPVVQGARIGVASGARRPTRNGSKFTFQNYQSNINKGLAPGTRRFAPNALNAFDPTISS